MGEDLLVGVESSSTTITAGGSVNHTKYIAMSSGSLNAIKFLSSYDLAQGDAEVGVYADNGGVPGALLTRSGVFRSVPNETNTISVPAIPIVAGMSYWLSIAAQYNFYKVSSGNKLRSWLSWPEPWVLPDPVDTSYSSSGGAIPLSGWDISSGGAGRLIGGKSHLIGGPSPLIGGPSPLIG